MPVAGGGFEQCYNAQAVVAAESLLVIAADVVQAPNEQIAPMLEKTAALPDQLGRIETLLATMAISARRMYWRARPPTSRR
jgi:hypothetical protein